MGSTTPGGAVVDTIQFLRTRLVPMLTILMLAACSASGVVVPAEQDPAAVDLETASLNIVSGDGQVGVVAQQAGLPLRVQVVDAQGLAVAAAPVVWEFADGAGRRPGGLVSTQTLTDYTDANGSAEALWTLGERAGIQMVTASIVLSAPDGGTAGAPGPPGGNGGGRGRKEFRATAEAAEPSRVSIEPGMATLAQGDTLRFSAVVVDAYGNPVDGPDVRWSSSDIQVADVDSVGLVTAVAPGLAQVRARSGNLSTRVDVSVVDGGVPPSGEPTLEVTPGGIVVQVDGTATFQAIARDGAGNVVTNAVIGWTTSDASVLALESPGVVRGVSAGTASIVAWWGEVSASQAVTVDPGGQPGVPVSMSAASPTSQQGIAGRAVGASPAVVVRDSGGQGVGGVTISFQAASGSGTVSPTQVVTDGSGRAEVESWVLGPTVGATNTLTASASGGELAGSQVTFTAVGGEEGSVGSGANFLWSSDWGHATGNALSAIQDNGQWQDRVCVGGAGVLIRVVDADNAIAGLPADWPTNILEVDHNGQNCDAVLVQNQWPAPAVGDTIWFRVLVWLDKCGLSTGPVHNVQSNVGNIGWTITEDQCSGGGVPIGFKSYLHGGGIQWSPGSSVPDNTPLRYEWGLVRQSTSRYGALVRVYNDATGTLLFDETDLRQYDGTTLAQFNASTGFDYSSIGPDTAFRSWILGQQGPGMATGMKTGAYNYGGAAVCNPGPCGRYTPGEGN